MVQTASNRRNEFIYQIYPASFSDANGDGHGDLKGITSKLSYIKKLGVDAIWISPFYPSPEGRKGDGGYAVSDHTKIAPQFGTMEDFDTLLTEAHKHGLRVYADFVLCHTADDHEWFQKSQRREPGYENRYVWHDGKTDEHGQRVPPNNWKSVFGGSAWSLDEERQQYYLRHFNHSQPALNLNDKNTQDAVLDVMKFWLDKGVDGFRLDALPFANYDPQFRDNPTRLDCPTPDHWQWQRFEHSMCQPQTIEFVERIRKLLDSYPGERIAIGEVIAGKDGGSRSVDVAKDYVHPKTGLDSCYTESLIQFFHYPTAKQLKTMLHEVNSKFADGGICNNASNHDFPRAASRMVDGVPMDMQSKVARQIMVLLTSLPGSFSMLQGEELRMQQARIPQDIPYNKIKDLVDPKPRDGARTPIPWNSRKKNAGFSSSDDPYLPVPAAHYARAVDLQDGDPSSMLEFTRALLHERKHNPALQNGTMRILDNAPENVVAFIRETPDQTALLAFNMSSHSVSFKPADILDTKTLKHLNIADDTKIHMGAYDYTRRGLREQDKTIELEQPVKIHSNGKKRAKTIVAADFMIADRIYDKTTSLGIAEKYNIPPGVKRVIDEEMHHGIEEHNHSNITLGGSTAITLWTLKKMMAHDVNINFMGVAAHDGDGVVARDTLKNAGVNLLVHAQSEGVKAQTATSHVLAYPNGQHSILTYPGTEKEAFKQVRRRKPNLIANAIEGCDVVYMPGSQVEKLGLPLTGDILRRRWDQQKELVLALPNHATFGPNDNQFFIGLIGSANVVMGSDDEFCRLYELSGATRPISKENIETVINNIQAAFKEKVLANNAMPCDRPQVAFITRGNKPALVVTADDVVKIPVAKIKGTKNHLGAGDATFAGFLYGYLNGYGHTQSATIAMEMAGAKVSQQNEHPYLDDPRSALRHILHAQNIHAERPSHHR